MDERKMQLRVGFVVLATLLVAGILVLLFNDTAEVLSTVLPSTFTGGKYDVQIRFDEAPNVDVHTPVRKSGIRIGRVSQIELLDDGGVLVTARIDGQRRVRRNEAFRTVSNLLGDAVVEVVPGDPARPDTLIEDGESVDGHTIPAPTQVLQELDQNLAEVIGSVNKAAGALETASGDLSSAAQQITSLLKTNRAEIDNLVVQANRTLKAVEQTAVDLDGLLGDEQTQRNLKDTFDRFPQALDKMELTMSQAESRLREMAPFTQALGSPQTLDRIKSGAQQLDTLLRELSAFSRRLNNRQGSLALLLEDRQLYDHLNGAAANIDQLTRQFKPIVNDIRIFTDKIARHPESLGVRGALQPSTGIK